MKSDVRRQTCERKHVTENGSDVSRVRIRYDIAEANSRHNDNHTNQTMQNKRYPDICVIAEHLTACETRSLDIIHVACTTTHQT